MKVWQAVLSMAALAASSTQAAVIFSDSVVDAGTASTTLAQERNIWKNNSVTVGTTIAIDGLAGFSVSTGSDYFLTVTNTYAYAELGQTLTTNWKLSVKAIQNGYGRGLAFGLTDADGKNGYLVNWDTNQMGQYGHKGSLIFRKYSSATPISTNGGGAGYTQLGTRAGSNHFVTGLAVTPASGAGPYSYDTSTFYGFATLELEYLDGKLTFSMDGTPISTMEYTDASPLGSFSRIYIQGGGNARFDDITVTATVPEVATLSLLGSASLLLLKRRR